MYWIGIKKLKKDLREGTFSDRDAVPYLIAEGVLTELGLLAGSKSNIFDIVAAVIGIAALILGILFVYKYHNRSSRSSFLACYISMGWVLSIRYILLFLPLVVVAALLGAIFHSTALTESALLLLTVVYYFVYYYKFAEHISEV